MSRSYTHIKQYYEEMEQMHQEGHSCREIGEKYEVGTLRLADFHQ